jgi:hypothetical protein
MDSDSLFDNFLQRAAFRSIQRERQPKLGSDPKTSAFRSTVKAIGRRTGDFLGQGLADDCNPLERIGVAENSMNFLRVAGPSARDQCLQENLTRARQVRSPTF